MQIKFRQLNRDYCHRKKLYESDQLDDPQKQKKKFFAVAELNFQINVIF